MGSNKIIIEKQFNTISISKQYNTNFKESNCLFDYIDNSFQLKSHLAKNNYSNPKTLFLFVISSFHSLTKGNYALSHQMLSSFITNLSLHPYSISYDPGSVTQYIKCIYSDYDRYITLINRKFDGLLTQASLCYLSSHSKHSIIILLFSLMIALTYISFDIDKTRTSKRETYHLLKSIKQKHLCQDMDRVMCSVCSLNSIRLVNDYLASFMTRSNYKSMSVKAIDEDNKNEQLKLKRSNSNTNSKSTVGDEMNGRVVHIVSLMESINSEISNLEGLIKNDEFDVENIILR